MFDLSKDFLFEQDFCSSRQLPFMNRKITVLGKYFLNQTWFHGKIGFLKSRFACTATFGMHGSY